MRPVVVKFSYGSFDRHYPKELDEHISKEEFISRITQLNVRARNSQFLAKLKFIPYAIFILTFIISLGVAFANYRQENDDKSHLPNGGGSKGYQFLYAISSMILSALLGFVIVKFIRWGRIKMRANAINGTLRSYNSEDASRGIYWKFLEDEETMKEYSVKHNLDISQLCLVIDISNSKIENHVPQYAHKFGTDATSFSGYTDFSHLQSSQISPPLHYSHELGLSRSPLTPPPKTQSKG